MHNYVAQALAQFKHKKPTQFHYGPSKVEPIQYNAKVQYSKPTDTRPISDKDYKFIQQVTGKFLFYARAVDPTMLHALNCIACGGGNTSKPGGYSILPQLCSMQSRQYNTLQKE